MNAQYKDKNHKVVGWSDVKRALNGTSYRDLLSLIGELYLLSRSNKDFMDARFLRNDSVLERYKDLIERYIAPHEPWKDSQQVSIKSTKKCSAIIEKQQTIKSN